MGPRGGGVPDGDTDNPKTLHTTINDHTGSGTKADATCVPVGAVDEKWAHVDADCVRDQMTVGRYTGLWVPPFNDCHEVVKDALDSCRTTEEPPPLGVGVRDAGAPETP